MRNLKISEKKKANLKLHLSNKAMNTKHLLILFYGLRKSSTNTTFEVFAEGVASPQFRGSQPGDQELPVTCFSGSLLSSLPHCPRLCAHSLSCRSGLPLPSTSSSLLSNPRFQHESDCINPLFKTVHEYVNPNVIYKTFYFFLTYFN